MAADATALLAEFERHFDFDDRERVLDHLHRHLHLVPMLVDVADQVPRYFRPDDRALLEVIEDPEAKQLYAIVWTGLPRDEAEVRLDRLDEEWWLEAVERARGDLTIDVTS